MLQSFARWAANPLANRWCTGFFSTGNPLHGRRLLPFGIRVQHNNTGPDVDLSFHLSPTPFPTNDERHASCTALKSHSSLPYRRTTFSQFSLHVTYLYLFLFLAKFTTTGTLLPNGLPSLPERRELFSTISLLSNLTAAQSFLCECDAPPISHVFPTFPPLFLAHLEHPQMHRLKIRGQTQSRPQSVVGMEEELGGTVRCNFAWMRATLTEISGFSGRCHWFRETEKMPLSSLFDPDA